MIKPRRDHLAWAGNAMGITAIGMFVLAAVVQHFWPRASLHVLGGMALVLVGLGFSLRTLSDGRKGILQRYMWVQPYTRSDLPRTFNASVVFGAAIGIILAMIGMWFAIAG